MEKHSDLMGCWCLEGAVHRVSRGSEEGPSPRWGTGSGKALCHRPGEHTGEGMGGEAHGVTEGKPQAHLGSHLARGVKNSPFKAIFLVPGSTFELGTFVVILT